jgi:hypothetical protein
VDAAVVEGPAWLLADEDDVVVLACCCCCGLLWLALDLCGDGDAALEAQVVPRVEDSQRAEVACK